MDLTIAELPQKIKDLHSRIARLVACYLVYRNGSKKELYRAAGNFGIDLIDRVPENPLRYWIVYAVVLVASVYIGVYASAIAYDLFTGKGLSFVQDQNRTLAWIMYTLCNYGLAIFLILLLRLTGRSLQIDLNQSHLITYCWTFLVAFVAGPFGLTLAAHFFGEGKFPETPLDQLYFHMLRWGLGPALVSVYISYYLDRQTCHDLPVVDHSSATFVWRLMNCFGFAAVNVFLLLPSFYRLLRSRMPAGIQPNCSSLLPVVCFTWHSDWPWRHNSHSGRARNPTRSRTCLFASVRRQIDHLRNGLKMGACRSGALAARRRPPMRQGLLPVPESPPRRNRAKQTQHVEGLTLGAHPNGHPPESRPLVLKEDYPRVPLALQQLRGTEAGKPSIAGAPAGSATWYGLSDHAGQG